MKNGMRGKVDLDISIQQNIQPGLRLNDSPVGLCGWLVEKYYGWADCKGNIENVFSKDELLAQVTLYWVTETIHSSIRLYQENSLSRCIFQRVIL